MPERFEQVKDICDERMCSVAFDLPDPDSDVLLNDIGSEDVVNRTSFRRCSPDVYDHEDTKV